MHGRLAEAEETPDTFLTKLRSGHIPRVAGTAVFLSRGGTAIPLVMVRHIEPERALRAPCPGLHAGAYRTHDDAGKPEVASTGS